jgi:acetyl esterase/lipase
MVHRDFPIPEDVTRESVLAEVDDRAPVRVLTFEAASRRRPSAAILWIHGGGTVLGKPEQSSSLVGRWARELGVLVVAPDYRLAPEHPYPAPLDDCYASLCWLHEHAETLGIDPSAIAVGGDSAGGLLAASLCQLARDRGGPPIRFQLLEYPMLDLPSDGPDPGPERSFVWSPAASRFGWKCYLANGSGPYAVPARNDDLSGLPPAWIGVGDIDLLQDEVVIYAARLRDAGVDCECWVESGMYHGADSIRADAPTARRFVDLMTDALRRGLNLPPTP